MNKEEFQSLLAEPRLASDSSIANLRTLLQQYPSFQTGAVLLAYIEKQQQGEPSPATLQAASLLVQDRNHFRKVLYGYAPWPFTAQTEVAWPVETENEEVETDTTSFAFAEPEPVSQAYVEDEISFEHKTTEQPHVEEEGPFDPNPSVDVSIEDTGLVAFAEIEDLHVSPEADQVEPTLVQEDEEVPEVSNAPVLEENIAPVVEEPQVYEPVTVDNSAPADNGFDELEKLMAQLRASQMQFENDLHRIEHVPEGQDVGVHFDTTIIPHVEEYLETIPPDSDFLETVKQRGEEANHLYSDEAPAPSFDHQQIAEELELGIPADTEQQTTPTSEEDNQNTVASNPDMIDDFLKIDFESDVRRNLVENATSSGDAIDPNVPLVKTETMAIILAKQGKIAEAVEIYRQLSLEQPDKSSYFAGQILELTSQYAK